ncbi:MAG: hypothetical protein CXZ00_01845 [Acidobacteria bacterium]|nr:MAG: hypothetical protein CXZ00_01845 [Acidobacteriota bacterium]
MKAGTENKTEVRIAIVLVVLAILTVSWTLMRGRKGVPAEASVPSAGKPQVKGTAQSSESIDPRLHLDLLANAEDVKYHGKGRNIFSAAPEPVEIPKVKISPLLRKQEEARRNLPPPPPPITLKYFGLASAKGEQAKAFLSQGEDIWIAREGDVVNRHYKIVRISPNAVEVEDLLNNNRQNIPLTQG